MPVWHEPCSRRAAANALGIQVVVVTPWGLPGIVIAIGLCFFQALRTISGVLHILQHARPYTNLFQTVRFTLMVQLR